MKRWLWNHLPAWVRLRVIAVLNRAIPPPRHHCPHCPAQIQASCLCAWQVYLWKRSHHG